METGITVGTSATTFSPEETCTYGHVLTFLWRCNGYPEAACISEYSEPLADKYYRDPVVWADSTGLMTWPTRLFDAEANCPRSCIVTYLYKNAGSPAYDAVPKTYKNDIPAATLGFQSESVYSDTTYSDGWIYYCDSSKLGRFEGNIMGGWLTRIRPDGTGRQVLVKDCTSRPQVSGGYVYFAKWTSDDGFDRHSFGQVWRIKLDGTDLSRVVYFGNDAYFDDFVVYGNYVFFSTSEGSGQTLVTGIWRQKLDGSERMLLIDDSSGSYLTVMDGRLYSTFNNCGLGLTYARLYGTPSDGYELCSMNLDGSDVQRYAASINAGYKIYNGRIYWVEDTLCNELDGLYVMDADGSNKTRLTAITSASFMPHGDYVYYVDYSGSGDRYYTFNRVKADGTGSEELLVLTDSEPGLLGSLYDVWYYNGAIIYSGTAFREGRNGWEWVKCTVENAPVFGTYAQTYETVKGKGLFDAQLSVNFTLKYSTPYSMTSGNRTTFKPADSVPGNGTWLEESIIPSADPLFQFERDGSYVNIRLTGTNLYVGIRAGVQEKGTELILWSKTGSNSQRFELVQVGNRDYKLKTTQGFYITTGEKQVEGETFPRDAYVLTTCEEMATVFTLSAK